MALRYWLVCTAVVSSPICVSVLRSRLVSCHVPSSAASWWIQCTQQTRYRTLHRWNHTSPLSRCPSFLRRILPRTAISQTPWGKPNIYKKRPTEENYSQNVCDHADRPHVLKISKRISLWIIHQIKAQENLTVANVIASKFTTSGATNSGVPNSTWSFVVGSYSRARPKSMILIRFPVSVKHKIFSG